MVNIRNDEKLQRQLGRIRRLLAESQSPLLRMTGEQVIRRLRKTRKALWGEKVALRPR